jgi:[protein-PII] uridylyltransferase
MALLPAPPGRLSGFSLGSLLPSRRKAPAEPVDGFKFIDGQIHASSPRVFRDQPRRLMRVFLHAQQRNLRLHPDLAQLIRNQLSLVDRAFLSDEHVRETFLTILNQRGSVAPVLRAMHEVDLLGKYIPEFGRLTCLVQHEFYHQYTADEHTLVCIEQLDRIWEAKQPPFDAYAPLFQHLERPFVLYLALLLHDIGKSDDSGKHEEIGGKLAGRIARRLSLDGAATHALCLVIEHHLLMAGISQRRDLDDPAVIRNFAKQIQNLENLSLLTLHTFVDAQATSDKLWNGFKDQLLWSLHDKTSRLMAGGTEFLRAEEKHRELLFEEVRRSLPGQFDLEELEAHFKHLSPRYFQVHSAREILDDVLLAHRFMRQQIAEAEQALVPVVNWSNEPDRGYSAVKICTFDRAGLFRKIAGSLSASGLNILSAQIFSRADGIALDTFFVTDARKGHVGNLEQREKFNDLLSKALTGEELDFHALIARQKITVPLYQAYTGERIPIRVHIDNESSDARTVIEVESEDRLGLLYEISETLTELQLDISAARICTERGAAIDSFYVHEIEGGKVSRSEDLQRIERALREAIASLDKRAAQSS